MPWYLPWGNGWEWAGWLRNQAVACGAADQPGQQLARLAGHGDRGRLPWRSDPVLGAVVCRHQQSCNAVRSGEAAGHQVQALAGELLWPVRRPVAEAQVDVVDLHFGQPPPEGEPGRVSAAAPAGH